MGIGNVALLTDGILHDEEPLIGDDFLFQRLDGCIIRGVIGLIELKEIGILEGFASDNVIPVFIDDGHLEIFEGTARESPSFREILPRDNAEKIGVHETTMSRLAQSKWVDTDWGLFQLKYFFTQGVATTSGNQESVSRNVVKDMIAEIISENGALSDQKISDMLLSRGIKCARRTVGKYRSELNIDSSYSR